MGSQIPNPGYPLVNGVRHDFSNVGAAYTVAYVNGKILVGGVSGGFLFVRYNTDGTLDTTFNPSQSDPSQNSAAVTLSQSNSGDAGFKILGTSDGNYLLAGRSQDSQGPVVSRFGLVKTTSARADLQTTISSDISQVLVDGTITYTITVKNAGDAASFPSIQDVLPAHTSFVSLSLPRDWVASTPAVGTAGTVVAARHSLSVDEGTQRFVLTVKLDGTQSANQLITNTVSATSATLDVNVADNAATTSVTAAEDLKIDMGTSNVHQVTAGDQVTFIATVDNHSALAASFDVTTAIPREYDVCLGDRPIHAGGKHTHVPCFESGGRRHEVNSIHCTSECNGILADNRRRGRHRSRLDNGRQLVNQSRVPDTSCQPGQLLESRRQRQRYGRDQ